MPALWVAVLSIAAGISGARAAPAARPAPAPRVAARASLLPALAPPTATGIAAAGPSLPVLPVPSVLPAPIPGLSPAAAAGPSPEPTLLGRLADLGASVFDGAKSGLGISALEKLGSQEYLVDGQPAPFIDRGGFKTVLGHPRDRGAILKIYDSSLLSRGDRAAGERDRDLAGIRRLARVDASPKLLASGSVVEDGRRVPWIAQERVLGATLDAAGPEALAHVRRLFSDLAKAGLLIADTKTERWPSNIMVGRVGGAAPRAYVVDSDLEDSALTRSQLDSIYAGLLRKLEFRIARTRQENPR